MILYFAYGSNMSSPRLQQRVGAVRLLGRARLEGYRHYFSKRGNDGTAKGNVEPEVGAVVEGILYGLDAAQLERLCTFESGYRQLTFEVVRQGGLRVEAHSFEALAVVRGLEPSSDYVEHYRAGAREHGLELDWLA